MNFKIKNKEIGDNNPTFIIAEGGINHNGNIKIAKKMIKKASESGADAIKFQTFTASDLTSVKSKYYKLFKKLEIDEDGFGEISDVAKENKIIFLSTPFSENAVDVLDKLKVPAFKIASGDLTHIPLIKYASAKNKPMIISTGMGTIKEIKDAIKVIKSQKNNKISILHSVSAYPPPYSDTNLRAILTLKNTFDVPIGYSDNGNDLLIPLIAVSIGAKIIEKHFTISKRMNGPDHMLSANPIEFKNMIKKIRIIEESLGDGKKQCQSSEFENIIHARRSITANIRIAKNMKIKSNMINIKRPAKGIDPKFINSVVGKITKKSIGKDKSIEWKDIR